MFIWYPAIVLYPNFAKHKAYILFATTPMFWFPISVSKLLIFCMSYEFATFGKFKYTKLCPISFALIKKLLMFANS